MSTSPATLTTHDLVEWRARRTARRIRTRQQMEADWRIWLPTVFPEYVDRAFSAYHAEYWDWVWGLAQDARPSSFVAIWPRGAGKSTSAEMAGAMVAALGTRAYALYICETQEQADDHVSNTAALLESSPFDQFYPSAASRKVGKFGNAKGWRRNRVRTASGFTLDAIGLDTAARGVKLEGDRPDLIILDDIDGKLDSAATTAKKIITITHTLLPAGSDDVAVLAVQNLVVPDGVFSQLADGRADFMAERIVSGPHPAIENLVIEDVSGKATITGGTPTWPEGMSIAVCQADLDNIGQTAFRAEKQHDVEPPSGGMFDHLVFRHCAWEDVPALVRVSVWVDPAVTNTDHSDSHGIQADGIDADDTVYRLYSWESRTTPQDVLQRAILKAIELGATEVGVETDQGGDTWRIVYEKARDVLVDQGRIRKGQAPPFRSAKAGAGHGPKAHRASQMLTAYERGTIIHVTGTHETLEKALRRFPASKPFDLVDAAYWSWWSLAGKRKPGKIVGV